MGKELNPAIHPSSVSKRLEWQLKTTRRSYFPLIGERLRAWVGKKEHGERRGITTQVRSETGAREREILYIFHNFCRFSFHIPSQSENIIGWRGEEKPRNHCTTPPISLTRSQTFFFFAVSLLL